MKNKPERTYRHPRFGEIPLINETYRTPDGKEGTYWTYDLKYKPPLPKGAVAGDPTRQNYCRACNVPKYFYVDEQRRCVDCGCDFTFWAKEQKYWYEDLGFNAHSTAIRCLDCRKARRGAAALEEAHGMAVRRARENAGDPCALLGLAEVATEYHEKTGKGDLARALAAARKARTLDPKLLESHFWEGAIHAAAGREDKALMAYDRFLALARHLLQYKPLVKRAEKLRRRK